MNRLERRPIKRPGYCRICREDQPPGTEVIFIYTRDSDVVLCLSCAECIGDLAITITGDLNGTDN